MDTDSRTELGWLWLSVFCSVYCGRVLEYFREVGAAVVIPWQMVFVKGDFSMTNEQQCHLKEKLFSELLEEVESIKTS
jgi:hypothetical protein